MILFDLPRENINNINSLLNVFHIFKRETRAHCNALTKLFLQEQIKNTVNCYFTFLNMFNFLITCPLGFFCVCNVQSDIRTKKIILYIQIYRFKTKQKIWISFFQRTHCHDLFERYKWNLSCKNSQLYRKEKTIYLPVQTMPPVFGIAHVCSPL